MSVFKVANSHTRCCCLLAAAGFRGFGQEGEPHPSLSPRADRWDSGGGGQSGGGAASALATTQGWASNDGMLSAPGTSVAGSENALSMSLASPEASPAKPLASAVAASAAAAAATAAAAAARGNRFLLDLGGAGWLADTPLGLATAGLDAGIPAGPAGPGAGLEHSMASPGRLWAPGGSASPGRFSQDEGSVGGGGGLSGLGPSSLWQSSGPDGWDLLSGSTAGAGGGSGAGGSSTGGSAVLSPGRLSQQQQREQALIAALDAAKAQLLQQQQQPRVCKYFVHGFCREGDKCRFSHVLPSASGAASAQLQLSLGGAVGAAGGGHGSGGSSSLGSGLLGGTSSFAFGAPASSAFHASAPGSRSATPELRSAGSGSSGHHAGGGLAGGGLHPSPAVSTAQLGALGSSLLAAGGAGGGLQRGGSLFGSSSSASSHRLGGAGGGGGLGLAGLQDSLGGRGSDQEREALASDFGLPPESSLFGDLVTSHPDGGAGGGEEQEGRTLRAVEDLPGFLEETLA